MIDIFAIALTGTFFASSGDADAALFEVTGITIPGTPDDVPLDPAAMKVDVTFNLPFDPKTVTADTLYIEKVAGGAKVPSDIKTYSSNNKRVSLQPKQPLQESTEYRLVIEPGIKTMPAMGVELPLWKRTTKSFKTTGPPRVILRQPKYFATDVPLDISIVVEFDRDMDYSTLNGTTFYLKEVNSGVHVSAKFEVVTPRMCRLLPHQNLKPNTYYSATLVTGPNGIKAKNGWELSKQVFNWNFTTTSSQQLMPSFSDVKPGDDYYGAIMFLALEGIISGYPDDTFRPKNPLWRAQFAKMVVNTLGHAVTEDHFPHPLVPFTDLGPDDPTDLYPHEYVAVCYLKGITKGSDPNDPTKFSPWIDIPRYQVISMVVRAAQDPTLGLLTMKPGPNDGKWRHDPIHGPNAAWAEVNGLLAGLDLDKLDPWGKMTRGETAQVLYNLYKMVH